MKETKERELMTLKEVAAFLNISYSGLLKWRVKKTFNIPCIKFGIRKIFYKRKDVENFIKNNEIQNYDGEKRNERK